MAGVPIVDAETHVLRSAADVTGRAKALCLVALKGQGLSQHEVFAFADAYEVWDSLTIAENDFVLDPAPPEAELIQHAWRYEGLWALEWALGLVRHLAFPDQPCDPGDAAQRCIESLAATASVPALRTDKDLFDAADLGRCLAAICASARAQGGAVPGNLDPGVVHERELALRWLIGLS